MWKIGYTRHSKPEVYKYKYLVMGLTHHQKKIISNFLKPEQPPKDDEEYDRAWERLIFIEISQLVKQCILGKDTNGASKSHIETYNPKIREWRNSGKDIKGIWKAFIKTNGFEKQLTNIPAKRYVQQLDKHINKLWHTSTPPARLGAAERHRKFNIAVLDHIRQHGVPSNIRHQYQHLVKKGLLNTGKYYSTDKPQVLGESAFRDILSKNFDIKGKPGRKKNSISPSKTKP